MVRLREIAARTRRTYAEEKDTATAVSLPSADFRTEVCGYSCSTGVSFDASGEVVVGVGNGLGMMMTVCFGGPEPDPSCAIAKVVLAAARTMKVASAGFIRVLHRVTGRGAGEGVCQSIGYVTGCDASVQSAPHRIPVPPNF